MSFERKEEKEDESWEGEEREAVGKNERKEGREGGKRETEERQRKKESLKKYKNAISSHPPNRTHF